MSAMLRLGIVVVALLPLAACTNEPARGPKTPSASAGTPSADVALTGEDTRASSGDTPATSDDAPSAGAETASAAPKGPFWPRFHGPKGDNLSTETGLLKQWPDGGPELVWSTTGIGHGFSSVAIANRVIYTDGNVDEKTVITAMDMDGKVLWQKENGAAWAKDHPGTRGTPTIDGDRLYHESPLGEVVCLDAKSGERIWARNILKEFGAENIQWALAESVVIDGNHAICCPGGPQASVVALDKGTGQTVWVAKGTGDKAGYATPTVAECQGLRMVLTMNAKALVGVNAAGGDFLFRHPHETSYDVNATSPIYHEGHIFITSGYGSGSEMLKLSVDGRKASVEPVWASKELDNHHGGVLLLDGYVYGSNAKGGKNNKWVCLNWETGDVAYSEPGVGKGSLTYADGMLYTFSENRQMGLAEATPSGHTVISRFELPSGGPGSSWAHPVVCGGRLYLRHSDRLSAYDVRAEP
ncbi:MAG TPA: PQQ-binding-like beta-propeller repeat protein [Thermoguttaceae bacterium]|nr:PQQ-binding-like beta-propeller repeat protein [Thermoguttaceae bacterium]